MKVVVLASYARSLTILRRPLLAALAAAGHEVLALAPDEVPEVRAELARLGVAFRTVPLERTGMSPRRDLAALVALVALLRAERPDALLAYTAKPVIYGGLAARLARVPRSFALITGLGYAFIEQGTARGRAVSAVVRTVVTDGSGVDLDAFTVAPLPAGGAPVFLLIARLLRDKGVVEYAAAARQVKARAPAARCLLLGPYDTNPTALRAADVEGWVREGAVEYLGEVADVRPVIAQASVVVLPSYREGIPRSVLEGMAMGRAIIATDVPGCRQTVTPGVTGLLVPPRDAAALAEAMIALGEDPARAAAMGAAGRALAEARFGTARVTATMLAAMGLGAGGAPIDPG